MLFAQDNIGEWMKIIVMGTGPFAVPTFRWLLESEHEIPMLVTRPIEDPGKIDLHMIEVQSGTYLGEDDIVRFEDIYKRS